MKARRSAQRVGAETGFEFEEVRGVDKSRDDFAQVIGLALVGGDDAQQFIGGVERLERRVAGCYGIPVELVDDVACRGDCVRIVVAQVLAQPGDGGVREGATKLLFARVFADRGLDQRRTRQIDRRPVAHQHNMFRQARQVGAARGRRPMNNGDLRNPRRRQPGLVGKAASALDKDLGLVQQVGATGLDQMDQRQLVFARDGLRPQGLLQTHRGDGAALERAVAGRYQAALAADNADADDATAAVDAGLAVVVVHAQTGQGTEFEEIAAAVDQARHAFARQQLTALLEARRLLGRGVDHALLERTDLVDARLHARHVGKVAGVARVERCRQRRHQRSTSGLIAR